MALLKRRGDAYENGTDALLYEARDGFIAVMCDDKAKGGAEELTKSMFSAAENDTEEKTAAYLSVRIDGARCEWRGFGDVRLYVFRKGRLLMASEDATAAYEEYAAGRLGYEEIRFDSSRERLCGSEKQGARELVPGDALLMCTDGFWQYVFETEMELDLIKSNSPDQWLRYMTLRAADRARFHGDDMTALAVFYEDGEIVM